MNKFVNSYYCFLISSAFMCNFKYVNSEGPIPLHPNYRGKYTSDIKTYEIVIPQRVNKDGSFISHFVSHHHSKRSTKELELIFYKIPIAGKEYLIELTPNRKLISPGAVIEVHREDAGKLSQREFQNRSSKGKKIDRMFENLNIRKLKNTECHFYGQVKGENISKAALSTCYGLAGFIQIKKGFYTIEPVAEHDPFVEDAYPHILYRADSVENSSVCHTMGKLKLSLVDQLIRKRRESNFAVGTPTYIETLVVMDKALINHHQDSDCENYVLTVFNMAFNLFHDASSGLTTTLTIVRMIRLEVENDEMNLRVNADAEKTLQYFQTWQYEINPGDDTHPNHHDIAVLITRVDVCYSPSSCGLLGLTTIGKACDPKLSAAICEDNGLRLGYVIAHEIGHLLGAEHDLPNSTCNGTDAGGLLTVMHPHVSLTTKTWSRCSEAYFKVFFDSGMGGCFLDEPEEHYFNVQDMLPGVMYNADFQCRGLITMNAQECEMGSTCKSLNCLVPGYACIVTHTPPADGTRCGENMWCHDTKCLIVGERPGAVDGSWSEWSAWSDCSRTCGAGVASSSRNCDKPLPSRGGKNCNGERKRYKVCAATVLSCINLIRFISEEVNVSFVGKPCETGRPSFRDIQCGEFDDWIYPEDGKTHTWRAHYLHDDNPCILYCISEEKQIAALQPRVVDGTMCYRGIRDICVGGSCKSLPCDLHFQSNAIEDACGICHGDGTSCDFSEGIETFTKLAKGVTKLVTVPSGTRNIKVEEISPTLARIVVRDKDTKDVYIKGNTLGMFNVPGSQAWLGMIKKNQEALNIPGPVTKPLSIWIQRYENVTVKWSMALPVEQQRKPEFKWDFLKWGPCSAECGPGTQKSEPSCIEEKAGLVESSFCADLEAPPTKVRPCEVAQCQPRWMVGDWKGCDQPGSKKKERKRVVYCIKSLGEGEGESQIVADSECPLPKPHHREPCENRQKREDTDSFFDEESMFRSETVEFGFHKKYDDYLKHFAALSVPQRKSETIPLHLLSSPHFKHYFRVLETPDEEAENDSDLSMDINLSNSSLPNSQTQNKVSPDFYRNTFSGNPVDVSHVRAKITVKKRNSASGEFIPEKSIKNVNEKLRRRQSEKHETESSSRGAFKSKLENIFKKCKLGLQNKKAHKWVTGEVTRDLPKSYFGDFPWRRYFLSSRDSRTLGEKLFSSKLDKNFNYTSPNLSDFIENISGNDSILKNRYLNLINKIGRLTPYQKAKVRNLQWKASNPNSHYQKFPSFLKPFSRFIGSDEERKGADLFKNFIGAKEFENLTNVPINNLRKLSNDEFDGSGVRKLSSESAKFAPSYPLRDDVGLIKKCDIQRWVAHKEKLNSSPFDRMSLARSDILSKKPNFRQRHIALEDLVFGKRSKRLRSKKGFLMKKRSVLPLRPSGNSKGNNLNAQLNDNYGINKKKRSNRKRKKTKTAQANYNKNKDLAANGCGAETRNYLNNLFRDSHPKIFTNKLEPKPPQEKPVIHAGRLVVDKDSVEDQQVEVIFQDDKRAEQDLKLLPRPDYNVKQITLRGQQVFDLLQSLQRGNGREAFYRSNGSKSKSSDAIEVNIKIPDTGGSKNSEGNTTTVKPVAQGETGSKSEPTESTSPKTTSASIQKSDKNAEDKNIESTTTKKQDSVPKPINTTETEKEGSTTGAQTTTATTTATTTEPSPDKTSGDSTSCEDYDVDEPVTETPETTTETTTKKREKKKNKEKEKSYGVDSDEGSVVEHKIEDKQLEDNKREYHARVCRDRRKLPQPQEVTRRRKWFMAVLDN